MVWVILPLSIIPGKLGLWVLPLSVHTGSFAGFFGDDRVAVQHVDTVDDVLAHVPDGDGAGREYIAVTSYVVFIHIDALQQIQRRGGQAVKLIQSLIKSRAWGV